METATLKTLRFLSFSHQSQSAGANLLSQKTERGIKEKAKYNRINKPSFYVGYYNVTTMSKSKSSRLGVIHSNHITEC